MPKSSKYLTVLDSLSDEDMDRPERAEYYDGRLFNALKEIASALSEKETGPDTPDYTKALNGISAMLSTADLSKEIKGLRSDMASIALAVAAIKSPDMGGVIRAIERMSASHDVLVEAMTAPRVLTYDAKGEPNGMVVQTESDD